MERRTRRAGYMIFFSPAMQFAIQDGRREDGVLPHADQHEIMSRKRILIPILENHQEGDGSVVVPEVLRKYMGGMERIGGK